VSSSTPPPQFVLTDTLSPVTVLVITFRCTVVIGDANASSVIVKGLVAEAITLANIAANIYV